MTINNAHQLLVVQEQESIKQVNTEIILGTDTPPRPWLSGMEEGAPGSWRVRFWPSVSCATRGASLGFVDLWEIGPWARRDDNPNQPRSWSMYVIRGAITTVLSSVKSRLLFRLLWTLPGWGVGGDRQLGSSRDSRPFRRYTFGPVWFSPEPLVNWHFHRVL